MQRLSSHLDREDSVSKDPRWDLIQRIVSSRHFQASARLREFLLYVGGCAIRDSPEEATEQHIGMCIFQRPPGYNSSQDSIVRSHAGHLPEMPITTVCRCMSRNDPQVASVSASRTPMRRIWRMPAIQTRAVTATSKTANACGVTMDQRRMTIARPLYSIMSTSFRLGTAASSLARGHFLTLLARGISAESGLSTPDRLLPCTTEQRYQTPQEEVRSDPIASAAESSQRAKVLINGLIPQPSSPRPSIPSAIQVLES